MIRSYLFKLISKYIRLHALEQNKLLVLESQESKIQKHLKGANVEIRQIEDDWQPKSNEDLDAEYIMLNGVLHFHDDIEDLLLRIRDQVKDETRIFLVYYSALWRPLIWLAKKLGMSGSPLQKNWTSPSDIVNFCELADWEIVQQQQRILMPIPFPLLSYFFNRFLAPLPFFKNFTLINTTLLRPKPKTYPKQYSATVIVPARNEAGNIENIVNRLPKMGPNDELIFIEGGSSDNTWEEIQRVAEKYKDQITIRYDRQDGKGKGDAVRKAYAMAEQEILMILDADITVPPEDLPRFFRMIESGKAEFVNGSRLFYPLEAKAMRFFNILGNKFFAMAFSFVLSHPLKDTLCGTKVLTKTNYLKLAANRDYFGEFDPFGDFDLLFGASRMGLKIVELPIHYQARVYGDTNIQRWKHGMILLRMLVFAASKIKFK